VAVALFGQVETGVGRVQVTIPAFSYTCSEAVCWPALSASYARELTSFVVVAVVRAVRAWPLG